MKKIENVMFIILFIIFLVRFSPVQASECVGGACSTNMTIEIVSGGAGGGGGGCSPDWVCDEWSECVDGKQTRTCRDLNRCGTPIRKPDESRACKISEKPETEIRGVLFDVNLELLEKTISPQKKLSIVITLINLGVPGKVSAELFYQIKDKKGEVVYEEKEVVPVETQIEFIKDINISELKEGEYTLLVDLSYEGQKEPAQAEGEFTIGKEGILSTLLDKLSLSKLFGKLSPLKLLKKPYIIAVFLVIVVFVILWIIKLKSIKKTKNSLLQD